MTSTNNYIGTGLKFPIELDAHGVPKLITGVELVSSSIKMILAWPRNQRIFLSRFGSGLEALLEEPNDQLLRGLVEYYISESLRTWEKRIRVLDVRVSRVKPESLQIELTYQISNQNISQILTFPFYPIDKAVLIN